MPNGDAAPAAIRAELIRLFEGDDWRMTARAETDGKAIQSQQGCKHATQWWICQYILEKLKSGAPVTETGMGDPKGSRGIGWELKSADGKGLYIKLKIEEGEVWILSFHY